MEGSRDPRMPDRDAGSASTSKRAREDDQGGQAKRHAPEGRRGESYDLHGIIPTRPHNKPQSADRAEIERFGERVKLTANYFRLPTLPEWSIYKYHSTFEPECLMARMKSAMIAQHKDRIGGFLFDGVQLFVTRELPADALNLVSRTRENTEYKITLKFTKIVNTNEAEYLQILNLILRRATHSLELKLVNRSYYDAEAKIDLTQFHIQLWPGYETSIRKYRYDIMVNCDIIHKVMRTDTVFDLMKDVHRADSANFQNSFKQKVLGMTVLTGYNNTTYRIDDVDFSLSPLTTFKRKKDGKMVDVSIKKYYEERYEITIRDDKQPLLITKPKLKTLRGSGDDKPTWLVPELCRITGLSEQQRNNIALKNAMKPYSQMMPHIRKERILAYNRRVQTTEKSMEVIHDWNLQLDRQLVQINGWRIKPETLRFGKDREHLVGNAGWDRECGRGLKLFQPVVLKRWYIVFPNQMERDINKFTNRLIELSRNMGFEVSNPRQVQVNHDRALANEVSKLAASNPQLIFFVAATNKNSNADIYSSIKKACFHDHAIPSQVATRFILTKDKGYDSVVTKIAIQMCSKLGGAPWSVKIPLPGVMTIGFDVSKDSQDKKTSFGCLVATMDLREKADFFATVASYNNTETLAKEFGIGVMKAIKVFLEKHQALPRKIIIYRGGVGDGDIPYLRDVEVKQVEDKLKAFYAQHETPLELVFMVVTKKINSRIFDGNTNPKPGTVVDDVITMNERYEFFLVSQQSNQGTVSPTSYNVIHDTTPDTFTMAKLQMWTYKHTHLYYNWCGTTRVPSVLQYATKLCFMVSNYMHRLPNDRLENSLYFL